MTILKCCAYVAFVSIKNKKVSAAIMENRTKRILLFLFGCMVTRYALAWIAYLYRHNAQFMRIMGLEAILPAVGILSIWLGGYRKTGPEVFGDKIWWNDLRPLHGLLWLVFACMAAFNIASTREHAWKILFLDTTIGLMAFIWHHFL